MRLSEHDGYIYSDGSTIGGGICDVFKHNHCDDPRFTEVGVADLDFVVGQDVGGRWDALVFDEFDLDGPSVVAG